MDSDPPGGIAPRLTKSFIACSILSAAGCANSRGKGTNEKKKNMLCYLQTRSTDCEGFLFRKPDLQPVALGWKSEGGACGGGREGGLSQKTFLIAFGLKRIS